MPKGWERLGVRGGSYIFDMKKIFYAGIICGIVLLSGCKTEKAVIDAGSVAIITTMDEQKEELAAFLSEETIIESVDNGKTLKLTFKSSQLFATNSNIINEASKNTLRKFAESLNNVPDTDIRITGYTDNTGRVDYNQTLSERRARSVYDYLCEQGVSSLRMDYAGKGIHEPVADNKTVEGRALNRRIEILIKAK